LKALNTSWAWAGCFETQPYPQNVNDIPPGASTPDSLYVPYLAPDEVDSQRTCSGSFCWNAGLQACTNAKAKGIIIYTVGFSVSSDPIDTQGQNLLQACATDKAHAFIANDGNSLVDAFNQIGIGMGKLRIKS
jgi:hypothetical protein